MEFRLLGPLEVESASGLVPLGGTRQRAALAYLLLHAGQVVSTRRLQSAVWAADRAPDTARKILQNTIWRLRRALDAPPDGLSPQLLTREPGYLVRVAPEQIDLVRFERLAARGRSALLAGDTEQAREALGQALVLWRGPALADLAEEGTAWPELAALEQKRLDAMEDRFEVELLCGRHRSVLREVDAFTQAEPLRERAVAQLMLALYRCGRRADALDVYARTRTALSEGLGLEPGHELQRLQRAVLTQDPWLDPPSPRRRTTAGETGARPGGRRTPGAAAGPGNGVRPGPASGGGRTAGRPGGAGRAAGADGGPGAGAAPSRAGEQPAARAGTAPAPASSSSGSASPSASASAGPGSRRPPRVPRPGGPTDPGGFADRGGPGRTAGEGTVGEGTVGGGAVQGAAGGSRPAVATATTVTAGPGPGGGDSAPVPPDRPPAGGPAADGLGGHRPSSVLLLRFSLGEEFDHLSARDADRVLDTVCELAREEIMRSGGCAATSIGSVLFGFFQDSPDDDDCAERAVRSGLAVRALLRDLAAAPTAPVPEGLSVHAAVATGTGYVRLWPPVSAGGCEPWTGGDLVDRCETMLCRTPPGEIHVCDSTRRRTEDRVTRYRPAAPPSTWRVRG
ncbi:BTAD domain-containing putative transcriptional regulator [Streptomyces sp. NPDC014894]|uniref:BTAD domain-containing putative transcriptional regulator n=1 Tax=Streptomyces sp. NPDC014894 TaxID=3364931 RepID=UPI0036FFF0C8